MPDLWVVIAGFEGVLGGGGRKAMLCRVLLVHSLIFDTLIFVDVHPTIHGSVRLLG